MQLWVWNCSKYTDPSRWASLRSTPAQNAGSAPVSTTARTDASSSASRSAAYNIPIRFGLNAFRASGRFMVNTRTAPVSCQELRGLPDKIEQRLREDAQADGDRRAHRDGGLTPEAGHHDMYR